MPPWLDVSPGGHLVTTAVVCAASQIVTGAWPLTAAIAAGGFVIDVDHMVDYVIFERARALTPGAFLRHYVEGRTRRAPGPPFPRSPDDRLQIFPPDLR